jgi:anti-sigma-K factor RskA
MRLAGDVPHASPSELLTHRFKRKLAESPTAEKKSGFSSSLLWKTWAIVASVMLVISLFSKDYIFGPLSPNNQQEPFRLIHALEGTEKAPDAKAWIYQDKLFQKKLFLVSGLKTLPIAQQYQLWLIKNGVRTSGAVFSISQPQQIVVINSDISLEFFQGFGVTIEPQGGSPGPTGNKVL